MADIGAARERVQTMLQQLVGSAPPQDEGGNWILPAGSARVMVNVVQPQPTLSPVVVVASAMLAQVQPSPDLLATLNQLNAQLSFVRIYWTNGFVFASTELIAESVDPPELMTAVSQIAQVADSYDDALRSRFGGLMPFAPGSMPTSPLGPQTGPITDPNLPSPPPGAVSPFTQQAQGQMPSSSPPQGIPGGFGASMPSAPPGVPPPPPGEAPTVTGT